MTAGKDQPLCGLDEVTTGGFSPYFSIVVFRCLRYATDLLHFVSEILSGDKTNGISGTFHSFSNL